MECATTAQARMGRKLPRDQQRYNLASLRLTLAEHAIIKRRAEQAGLSVAAYVRTMVLGSDIKTVSEAQA